MDIMLAAEEKLRDLMKDHDVGGHGIDHMFAVADHAKKALELEVLSGQTKLQIYLAALLHDADEDKIFKNSKNYENARRILNEVLTPEETRIFYIEAMEYNPDSIQTEEDYRSNYIEEIIQMIALVSCSKNGDSTPHQRYMAIPRDCDRLEAIGIIGIQRCLEYANHIGNPLHTENTPRVYTEEELWKVATPERFANYKKSVSVIDHYYDKLLHIGASERLKSKNEYILEEAARRNQVMIDYVLNYWKNLKTTDIKAPSQLI